MTVIKTCVECGKDMYIEDILPRQYNEIQRKDRRCIQVILPHIRKEDRELFISGVCGDCWHDITGEYLGNEDKI